MLKSIVKYEADKLTHSSKIMIPIIIYAAYMGFAYTIAPLGILSSFGICNLVLFLIMLAIGVMYDDINNQMIEQAIYVRLENKTFLYWGRICLLLCISLLFSVLSVLLPVILHLSGGGALFDRAVTASDLFSGLCLFFITAAVGGVLGLLANRRVLNNRSMLIGISTVIGIASIVRVSIIESTTWGKFFTWMLPPVSELSISYAGDAYFSIGNTYKYFIWMIFYLAAVIFFYLWIMHKKGFE